MTEHPQTPLPLVPDRTPASRRRRQQVTAVSLVGAGVVTGGILAGTLSAGASTSSGTKATPAATSSAAASTAAPLPPDGPHGRMGRLAQTGTVTAVGPTSVTVKTATATSTFQVTSASTVVKGGAAGLSGVKVGDTVHFRTTTSGGTVIAVLVDGVPAGRFGRFGGFGGPGRFGPGRLDQTGTATAVGATSVTVKSGTATTTYQVTSGSRLFANGSTKVSSIKVGDPVRFSTTTSGGTTIAVLVDGQPPAGGPHDRGAGAGRGWGPPA